MPDLTSICWTPAGVAGRKSGSPMSILPTLDGWKQSTSFEGSMASITASSSMWSGSGSCTRYPCIDGSAFSSATFLRSSSWVVSFGMTIVIDLMPSSSHISPFFLT